MTLFVDASALVAIVVSEEGHQEYASRIIADGSPIWSALSRWETIRAVSRLLKISVDGAAALVDLYVSDFFRLVPIGEEEGKIAIEAHCIYGKGNHPAELNIDDCFAYACARANGAALLYKGDDFARTDLA